MKRNVNDYWILGKFVEVGYRSDEDRRGRGNGGDLAGANWVICGEEWVGIMADWYDLGSISDMVGVVGLQL